MCNGSVENMVTTSYEVFQESTNTPKETALILSARQGDLDAFNQLVLEYQDRIYNLAVRILGDDYGAEDITQNTFLKAYLELPRFRNGSFRSWLYQIATHACYDVYRQYKRHPVVSMGNKDLEEERISSLDDFSSSSQFPEIELERHELARIVQRALNQLQIDQRTVVILVDQQEFDYREAAKVMGIPVGTVKSRLARARMRLHQILSALLDSFP
jgi:RNA polymerase sigma-70 factor (ECF subfamily)